ncbi:MULTISPECIES: TerC family protein [unclassified Rhizobium]|uniref:TerC family protein n=1 Tax=unclassified Rhizobium TaxID=2613769 RepID=UPI003FA74ACA
MRGGHHDVKQVCRSVCDPKESVLPDRLTCWPTSCSKPATAVLIEVADVIFAVDSVPAIFAITTDPFIGYTSNIFAILGSSGIWNGVWNGAGPGRSPDRGWTRDRLAPFCP